MAILGLILALVREDATLVLPFAAVAIALNLLVAPRVDAIVARTRRLIHGLPASG